MVNYYGPEIYCLLGIETGTSLMIIGISGALSIVYCTIGLLLVDRVGRIKPLIVSAAGMAAALVANAAMSQRLDGGSASQLQAMVAMNFVFSFFYTPTRHHLMGSPRGNLPGRSASARKRYHDVH